MKLDGPVGGQTVKDVTQGAVLTEPRTSSPGGERDLSPAAISLCNQKCMLKGTEIKNFPRVVVR